MVGYSPWGRKESDTTEQLTPSLKGEGDSLKRVSRRIIQAMKLSKSMVSLLHAYRMAMVCWTWSLRVKPVGKGGQGHRWNGGLSSVPNRTHG